MLFRSINANSVFDPNNPALMLKKCGRVEPALAAIQNIFGNCLCMKGNYSEQFTYTQSTNFPTCGLTNPTANGIANMLDSVLRWLLAFVTRASQLFPNQIIWPECLCCGGQGKKAGMVIPFGNMIVVGLRQVLELARNIPNPTYWTIDRKSTRLNSSHIQKSRMPSSA